MTPWTFTLQDVGLAILLGTILGSWVASRHGKGHPKEEPFARLVSSFWEPVTYWFDLCGQDGRPSLTKLCYVMVLIAAVYGMIAFGQVEVGREGYAGLSWGFLAYVCMTMMYGLGRQVFVAAFDSVQAFIVGKFGDKPAMIARQSSGNVQRPPEAMP